MPKQLKSKKTKGEARHDVYGPLFWKLEEGSIIVDYPEGFIHATKISVLEPFIKDFKERTAKQSKLQAFKEFSDPLFAIIKEVAAVYVSISLENSRMFISVLTTVTKFNRDLSRMIFDVRLQIEERYDDYEIDFIDIPLFGRREDEVVSRNSAKVYP